MNSIFYAKANRGKSLLSSYFCISLAGVCIFYLYLAFLTYLGLNEKSRKYKEMLE